MDKNSTNNQKKWFKNRIIQSAHKRQNGHNICKIIYFAFLDIIKKYKKTLRLLTQKIYYKKSEIKIIRKC